MSSDKHSTRRFQEDVATSHGFLSNRWSANARVLTLRICFNQHSKCDSQAQLEQIAVRDSEAASAHYNRVLGAAEGFLEVDLDAWPDFYELAERPVGSEDSPPMPPEVLDEHD